jgi:hypothetical protein
MNATVWTQMITLSRHAETEVLAWLTDSATV